MNIVKTVNLLKTYNTGVEVKALSNAYNSFKINLISRKRNFKLLNTFGMTEKRVNKMVFLEGKIVFLNFLLIYTLMFLSIIFFRAYRSDYE